MIISPLAIVLLLQLSWLVMSDNMTDLYNSKRVDSLRSALSALRLHDEGQLHAMNGTATIEIFEPGAGDLWALGEAIYSLFPKTRAVSYPKCSIQLVVDPWPMEGDKYEGSSNHWSTINEEKERKTTFLQVNDWKGSSNYVTVADTDTLTGSLSFIELFFTYFGCYRSSLFACTFGAALVPNAGLWLSNDLIRWKLGEKGVNTERCGYDNKGFKLTGTDRAIMRIPRNLFEAKTYSDIYKRLSVDKWTMGIDNNDGACGWGYYKEFQSNPWCDPNTV